MDNEVKATVADGGTTVAESGDGAESNNSGQPQRRWIFAAYARVGTHTSLVLMLAFFVLYLVGSARDPGFSDDTLFVLLRLLRYASLMLSGFALFSMGASVHRMARTPRARVALSVALYFFLALLGAFFSLLDSFIVVATEGNL